jgi:putative DNA primase/helicase
LAPLLGKPLAIVSDARLGRDGSAAVVERLLSISGEDMLTIDRKYQEQWTGKLPTRFLILSNELPRFGDASGAIANRFIVMTMQQSFLGKENTRLTDELLTELPGILLWALDGLDRLVRSSFTAPAASDDAILALQDLVSPVAAFVRDCCDKGTGLEVSIAGLFNAWKMWCEDNGHRPGSAQTFGRDLRAVIPHLRVLRPREDGNSRERRYAGVALRTPHNAQDRGPLRTDPENGPPVRDGPRPNPMWAQHDEPIPTCGVCQAWLLAPESQRRGICEKCYRQLNPKGTNQ